MLLPRRKSEDEDGDDDECARSRYAFPEIEIAVALVIPCVQKLGWPGAGTCAQKCALGSVVVARVSKQLVRPGKCFQTYSPQNEKQDSGNDFLRVGGAEIRRALNPRGP